jgi:anthranilate synthase/aminodeoxychorismate synthase-like glutamine amidotransferase
VRVLLIDNYDSFAYNLVQALRALGAEVLVRRNDAVDVPEALALAPAAVVLSPGPCTPAEAGVSVGLVRAAAQSELPLLGVCLGHQAIGAAFGGRIVQAARLLHGKTSEVHHDGAAVFADLPSPFTAMRYHSLVIEEPLPRELVRTAWTVPSVPGQAAELMGVRHERLPIEGVQFHPESYLTTSGPSLLDNFLSIARRGR